MATKDDSDFVGANKPYWFKESKFYKNLRNAELSDEYCLQGAGDIPDKTPEELWPEESEPLTDREVKDFLRVNKLRQLYLKNEEEEIKYLGNRKYLPDNAIYFEFVEHLTYCIELLGEQYVNCMLEPLGFKQEYYVGFKKIG